MIGKVTCETMHQKCVISIPRCVVSIFFKAVHNKSFRSRTVLDFVVDAEILLLLIIA